MISDPHVPVLLPIEAIVRQSDDAFLLAHLATGLPEVMCGHHGLSLDEWLLVARDEDTAAVTPAAVVGFSSSCSPRRLLALSLSCVAAAARQGEGGRRGRR